MTCGSFQGATTRLDAIVVWPHGVRFSEAIVAEIRKNSRFELLKVIRHEPSDLGRFVRAVYSRDYVPFEHLQAKTEYLRGMKPLLDILFVRTSDPEEVVVGEGWYAHVESEVVREFKSRIRDQFNPRKGGKRTEEHVVHVTDHESHTHQLLQLLGIAKGIEYLKGLPNPVIHGPAHLSSFSRFRLKPVPWSSVVASILVGEASGREKALRPVEETPQYRFLMGHTDEYVAYLTKFTGTRLTDGHSVAKFQSLAKSLAYMDPPFHLNPVLAQLDKNGVYRIVDGVHRAAILRYQGVSQLLLAVVD
ncbi:MAG: hypothetical protein Fues2KO_26290 [Fuerstiella sp.]